MDSKPIGRLIFFLLLACWSQFCFAKSESFDSWLSVIKAEAIQQGISRNTVTDAFAGVQFDASVIQLDRNQPEFKSKLDNYLSKRVNKYSIWLGKRKIEKNKSLLTGIAKSYSVDLPYIVAIWGLESGYGSLPQKYDIFQTLSTLAYDSRRGAYFRNELFSALKILEQGHISRELMKGSYLGAMGQPQFMPSTFLNISQDYNQDGKRDIWSDKSDALASIAAYLHKVGDWQFGHPWGYKVSLPDSLEVKSLNGATKSLSDWKRLGIASQHQRQPLEGSTQITLLIMNKGEGPAYFTYQNFKAVLSYNPSDYYALAVCMLAERLAGN